MKSVDLFFKCLSYSLCILLFLVIFFADLNEAMNLGLIL